MKRPVLAASLMLFALISEVVIAQTIVENPAKPDNPRAGRVVTLEEVMRIEDTGKDFYIKAVYGLAVGPDGSVFVRDGQKQLLQFDSRGRFVRNLMKIGQGPGEMTNSLDLMVEDGRVFLLGIPPKLLIFDFSGGVLREVGLQDISRGMERLIASTAQGFLALRRGRPGARAATGWQDVSQEIVAVPLTGGDPEVIGSFATPSFVELMPGGGTRTTGSISLLFAPVDGRFLALSHTPEYQVKVFDIQTRTVKAAFKRPYKRAERPDGGGGITAAGGSSFAPPKHFNDVSWLHPVGGRIWIQTSTADAKQGILFDVYDTEGRYLDCFFLKHKAEELKPFERLKRFVFSGGFVYFDDRTEDDLVVIRKCRLIGL